jgi:hypothetical protein
VVVLLHNDGSFLARTLDWENAMGKSVSYFAERDRSFRVSVTDGWMLNE